MRGRKQQQGSMLFVLNPEQRIRPNHPLRAVKVLTDDVLTRLSPLFDLMYSEEGRPSIPPEQLLKASLLMALYSVRSERLFCEELDFNLLYRWFLDLGLGEESFDHSTFTLYRRRLLAHEVAQRFLAEVVQLARERKLLSAEHFTVDGTLIEAWASLKSFRRTDETPPPPDDPGNPTVDFRHEKRSNKTHQSTTDPESRLARKGKGKEAKLCFSLHALTENRHGLVLDLRVDQADGYAERKNALHMLTEHAGTGATVGADKAYDTRDFVKGCRERGVTPHVAQYLKRRGGSMIDGRTTRHGGYAVSQRKRKRIEEVFGWLKTIACFRRTRFKGKERTQVWASLLGAAYNLLRIAKLSASPT